MLTFSVVVVVVMLLKSFSCFCNLQKAFTNEILSCVVSLFFETMHGEQVLNNI